MKIRIHTITLLILALDVSATSFASTPIDPGSRIGRMLSNAVKLQDSSRNIVQISTGSGASIYKIDVLSRPVILESGFCKIISLQYLVQINNSAASTAITDATVFQAYAEPIDGKCDGKGKGYATAETLDGLDAQYALFELRRILDCVHNGHCAKQLTFVDIDQFKKTLGDAQMKNLISFKADKGCRMFTFLGLSLKACDSSVRGSVTVEAQQETIETQ
jgi:hypothetical protein